MKQKSIEFGKYILSLVFFYAIFNYIRNVFFRPFIYDVFMCEDRKAITVIGPYYSLRGFMGTSCVYTFSDGQGVTQASVVDDPDKNCLIVLFNLPGNVPDSFEYAIMRGTRKLFFGTHVNHAASPPAKNKYALSIATLFKYEADFLSEWIDHHRSLGVEHFFLYENNAVPDMKIAAILGPYIRQGSVTHIIWPYPYHFYNYKVRKLWPNDAFVYTQVPQINHCLYNYGIRTEWLLACDVDEYFYSPAYGNLAKAIDMIRKKCDISSIRIAGLWFGGTSADLEKAKIAGVRQSFVFSEKNPTSGRKCIFNTKSVRLASVHNSVVHDKREIDVSPDEIRFNHYRALGWKKRLDHDFARDTENRDIFQPR